jgi:hypothetical protein
MNAFALQGFAVARIADNDVVFLGLTFLWFGFSVLSWHFAPNRELVSLDDSGTRRA